MIEVLGMALYGPLAASTRYRMAQYAPGLAVQGIDLRIHSLLGDDYLRRRFAGGLLPVAAMLRAGMDRFAQLRRSRATIALVHCELLPLMPGLIERRLLSARPYAYDFDDAFYLKYRRGRLGALRPMLGGKFDAVMRGAAVVTAGNRTLADYASTVRAGDDVRCLPTVVDTRRYLPARRPSGGVFTIGWIGSASTAPYLGELVAPLQRLGKEGAVRLLVVGGRAPAIPGIEVREVPWSEEAEIDLINTMDVGVMPLPDDDWARGKCAFKLIQYMACAVPVVGSAVGANLDVVTPDCGYLASSPEEWLQALRYLRDSPARASAMGDAGRERVVRHYSLEHALPLMADAIRTAAAAA